MRDGDGMHDGFEYSLYGVDDYGPDDDTDNDGLTWEQEYMYGSSPLSSDTDGDGVPGALASALRDGMRSIDKSGPGNHWDKRSSASRHARRRV